VKFSRVKQASDGFLDDSLAPGKLNSARSKFLSALQKAIYKDRREDYYSERQLYRSITPSESFLRKRGKEERRKEE
jgi:hypothetical protein